jgi:hypothetical protein
MALPSEHLMSRRGFCLCCMAATTFAASGGWLTPRRAFAKARNIVDLIRDDAARAAIKTHKLRGNVCILEGSGGNIAVLTGPTASCSSMPELPRPAPGCWRPRAASAAIQSST